MNNTFKDFFYALWYQDLVAFSKFDNFVTIIYFLSFFILFLENGVIIASFLPGDTLLIFLGILISKGILSFPFTLGLLTVAAALGSWCSYLQGYWLGGGELKKKRIFYIPKRHLLFSYRIFHSYGLFALFISRFIVFVRTLIPIMAGISRLNSIYFHFFNWISAFFWILILTLLGFFLGRAEYIQVYRHNLEFYLIFFVVVFLVIFFVVQFIRNVLKKYL